MFIFRRILGRMIILLSIAFGYHNRQSLVWLMDKKKLKPFKLLLNKYRFFLFTSRRDSRWCSVGIQWQFKTTRSFFLVVRRDLVNATIIFLPFPSQVTSSSLVANGRWKIEFCSLFVLRHRSAATSFFSRVVIATFTLLLTAFSIKTSTERRNRTRRSFYDTILVELNFATFQLFG